MTITDAEAIERATQLGMLAGADKAAALKNLAAQADTHVHRDTEA